MKSGRSSYFSYRALPSPPSLLQCTFLLKRVFVEFNLQTAQELYLFLNSRFLRHNIEMFHFFRLWLTLRCLWWYVIAINFRFNFCLRYSLLHLPAIVQTGDLQHLSKNNSAAFSLDPSIVSFWSQWCRERFLRGSLKSLFLWIRLCPSIPNVLLIFLCLKVETDQKCSW